MVKNIFNKKGFTLIEALLGAMVFSVIALSIYTVFSQGLNIERRLHKSPMINRDVFLALQEMTVDLTHAKLFSPESEDKQPYFDGTHEEISFLIADEDGLRKVHYGLSEPEIVEVYREEVNMDAQDLGNNIIAVRREEIHSAKMLVRASTPLTSEGDRVREILTEQIARDGFKIFYLQIDEDGQRIWKNEWQEQGLPVAVRLDLKVLNDQQLPFHLIRDVYIPAGGNDYGKNL